MASEVEDLDQIIQLHVSQLITNKNRTGLEDLVDTLEYWVNEITEKLEAID